MAVIFFLFAGPAKANSMIYYTQSYFPFQMISADLSNPGTSKVIYNSGSGNPYAIAVDATNKCLYFSDPNPTVAKIFSGPLDGDAGDYTTFISNVSAEGIAVDPVHGYIYYAQPSTGNVVRANLTDGSGQQPIYSSAGAPRAVAVDPVGGYIYIADYNLGKIIRANLDGNNQIDFITNVHAKGIGIDTTHGKIYYTDAYNPNYNLVCANLADGSGAEILYSSATGSPGAIAVDPVNGYIYFSDWHSTVAKIFKAELDGSNRVELINGVNSYGIGLYIEPAIFTISGTISDFQGGLQGATVDAGNGNTAVTDASGNFSLSLPNGTYTLTVSKNGYLSSTMGITVSGSNITGQNLTLSKVPEVTGIGPSSGPESGGTIVTISGTGFTGATSVNFGPAVGTNLSVISDTLISVTSPAGTGTIDVTVTTPGGTSASNSSDEFTYTDTSLISITAPSAITGVANGTAKTAAALGLPSSVVMVTDNGSVNASVNWDVNASTYDESTTTEQTFSVNGTVTLPTGVVNPNSVALTTTISVTVDAAAAVDKTLISITAPSAITGVANGTAKTAAALGLPSSVVMVTDNGSVNASVSWDINASTYDVTTTTEQTFSVNGTVTLPTGVVNPNSVGLTTTISVTVDAAAAVDKTLISITAPSAITGVANGTAKTAAALGLPSSVVMVTDNGSVNASVNWDVNASTYDESTTTEQTFSVNGTVTLPTGVVNPNRVALTTTISVTVDAAAAVDKTLISITAPSAITGVANGTAKTAAALGLPSSVVMVTDNGSVNASVSWDVNASTYDESTTTEQTFSVNGTVTLATGVVNPNSVALTTTISVTVDAAAAVDKTLISITAPSAITGVANGTAKTAAALGLPSSVVMVTDNGSVNASVNWDVNASTYDESTTTEQTFSVNGTVTLPTGVVNPNSVALTTTISVTVDAAAAVDKTLISITAPSAITGVANGTAKTAAALGLPSSVVMVTDNGSVNASVNWDVNASTYDESTTTEQTFSVNGTVTLPTGVVNPNSVALTTTISVTVNAATNTGGSSSSSSGGSSGGATPSTVTGDVINGKTGQVVKGIETQVTTESNGTKTVEVKSKEVIVFRQPDGNQSSVSDSSRLGINAITNADSKITLKADGTIQIKNLAAGTDSIFTVTYDLGNGQKITIGTIEVKVGSDGKVSFTYTLIDPYGIITDPTTGKVIVGVDVTLYYANTERNKNTGKTPDSIVQLPVLDGFKPNNNKNPQVSDASGAYGFMVFPTSDYYIVAKKDGYEAYRSPTISVEQDIVKWDFKMNKSISGLMRLSGLTSVDTALEIAKANYTTKLTNVVLTTAENYPDALAGSVLAYKLNAPILLVGSTEVDQEKILAYIKTNLDTTGTVYILGGTAAVSSEMEDKVIASGFNHVTRLGGIDCYETSVKITDQLGVKNGTPIVLAYGGNYPDALSISSIAAETQYPILLVQKDELSDAVKNEITIIKPTKVYIIGGEGVISTTVESQVAQITSLDKTNIVRIAGADRYETSLAVAKYFDLSGQSVCIATGNNFPDALTGSVYAANYNASIILADGGLSDQIMNYLKEKKITGATLFGGEEVVSKVIEQQLGQLIEK
ncbi:cell wall-binding protein [Desulfosporosinus orientis DSM 765]|uniref:Cell wall-binding protein n=1 Tax=Desulfosporosinus orientis (strain ATCC 19365 / DSM 765 / NCIMB 8382 / VKM B-1628 / Singapore I) TaxID=768706 RepID=G7WG92_DESOD|nr:cell wall-binding repeat-containing protein [Desulfosporosinus orientis]AET70824.1 cell wall-binding protein [Desulfosporosinus orientis DSM 765]